MSEHTEHKEREPKQQKQQQKKQKQTQQQSKEKQTQQKENSKQNSIEENSSSKQPRQRPTPKLALFDHLTPRAPERGPCIQSDSSIHPAIVKLGALYKTGSIQDDDDRAYALVVAFHNVITDYTTPPNKSLSWDLDKYVKTQFQYLVNCRQHSMAMGNIVKFIRFAISEVSPEMNEADAKTIIADKMQNFLDERIIYARENINHHCADNIRDGDVILTFGSSPVLRGVLLHAATVKKRSFSLVVVDSLPLQEGIRTLAALSPFIQCAYTPMAGASRAMKDATRVLLGASALLSNGTIFGAAGTGMIACLAKNFRVPVIFAAESYKFCEKVQLDSIVYNELGNYRELLKPDPAVDSQGFIPQERVGYQGVDVAGSSGANGSIFSASSFGCESPAVPPPPFQVLNLRYDLTSMRNVSAVITEVGLIPPTSIPVLIRELRLDQR